MVREYELQVGIALDYLERRENNAGRPVAEGEAHRAAKLRDPQYDLYASDGRHEVPMSAWGVVWIQPTYQPASANDLRVELERRRRGQGLLGFDEPTTSDGYQRPPRGDRIPFAEQPMHARYESSSDESKSDEPSWKAQFATAT